MPLSSWAALKKLFIPLVLTYIRRGCFLLSLLAGFLFSYLLVGCSFIMSVLSPKINYHEIELARYLPKWHLPSSASFQCERNNAAPAGRSARPPGHPPALSLAELPLSLPSPLPVPCSILFNFFPPFFTFFFPQSYKVMMPSLLAVVKLWVAALNQCMRFSGVLFRRGFICFIFTYLFIYLLPSLNISSLLQHKVCRVVAGID